jgi:hypothetical protein
MIEYKTLSGRAIRAIYGNWIQSLDSAALGASGISVSWSKFALVKYVDLGLMQGWHKYTPGILAIHTILYRTHQ